MNDDNRERGDEIPYGHWHEGDLRMQAAQRAFDREQREWRQNSLKFDRAVIEWLTARHKGKP